MPKVVNDAHALPAFDDFESEVLDGQLSGITEELPIFFTSVEEYISKFYSLLLQEARHDVASAYESAVGKCSISAYFDVSNLSQLKEISSASTF